MKAIESTQLRFIIGGSGAAGLLPQGAVESEPVMAGRQPFMSIMVNAPASANAVAVHSSKKG